MKTGTFLVSYQTTQTLDGGYTLHLDLVIDRVHHVAAGTAAITQALADPVIFAGPVTGPVIDMTVMPKQTSHQLKLESPKSDLLGAPHVNVLAVVGDDWQKGTANVTLFRDSPQLVQFTTPIAAVHTPEAMQAAK